VLQAYSMLPPYRRHIYLSPSLRAGRLGSRLVTCPAEIPVSPEIPPDPPVDFPFRQFYWLATSPRC
jgi:hypothetical protein